MMRHRDSGTACPRLAAAQPEWQRAQGATDTALRRLGAEVLAEPIPERLLAVLRAQDSDNGLHRP